MTAPMGYEAVKALAAELRRPVSTPLRPEPAVRSVLLGLSRWVIDAQWFADIWRKHGVQGGHIRRLHYRMVSQETPLLMPDGSLYINTDECWTQLGVAGQGARYQDLVDAALLGDKRSPLPRIHLDAPLGEREAPWVHSYRWVTPLPAVPGDAAAARRAAVLGPELAGSASPPAALSPRDLGREIRRRRHRACRWPSATAELLRRSSAKRAQACRDLVDVPSAAGDRCGSSTSPTSTRRANHAGRGRAQDRVHSRRARARSRHRGPPDRVDATAVYRPEAAADADQGADRGKAGSRSGTVRARPSSTRSKRSTLACCGRLIEDRDRALSRPDPRMSAPKRRYDEAFRTVSAEIEALNETVL